jgi:hypothetical protein
MKQEETIRVSRAELSIEAFDAVARGGKNRRVPGQVAGIGVDEVAEDREMDSGIEVSQCEYFSSRAITEVVLVSIVGTTTIVRASSGSCLEKSRRGRRRGGIAQATIRCASAMATSAAGTIRSRRKTHTAGHAVPAWRAYAAAAASIAAVITPIGPR